MQETWYSREENDLEKELDTSLDSGLSEDKAEERREKYGKNEIESGKAISPLEILVSQFKDFLIWILLAAAVVSIFLGQVVDATLIFIILIANGIFGFVQDYKAEESIQALKDMSTPSTFVLRDGEKRKVDATELVPGDIVFLSSGDAVPADGRILSQENLKVDESALTGESEGVDKHNSVLEEDTPLAERKNMVYRNTTVQRGSGKFLVTSTGMDTEVGKIAESIQESERKDTPFQEEVNALGKKIGIIILIVSALVGLAEFTVGNSQLIDIFLASIGLAVAAVPEGLPAVVTLALAMGSRKMVDKDALVRRLPVVESLGSVDAICTDKTGTLTEDRMTVRKVFYDNMEVDVSGTGYSTEGEFTLGGKEFDSSRIEELLTCGAVCNNAEKGLDEEGSKTYLGSPTENALLVSAEKAGLDKEELDNRYDRLGEVPFSSDRKRMTTVNHDKENDRNVAFMKGAPKEVLGRCDRIKLDGKEKELTEERREEVLDRVEEFAGEALRVLGFAYREGVDEANPEVENDMVFLGLQGMIDPPREEVKDAIDDCRNAGIKVVMVTGDNKETAKAIGGEIGFKSDKALTGSDIDDLSEEELAEEVEGVEIFARVSPQHKVRILEALQSKGFNVAMTGDGVNDAPAVKDADVGISMGERGTDVTEQTSDMVLLDDNFVSIRDAISEGRGIFDNIRKFVNYLLSANAGEVLLVFLGSIFGLGLVLTAVQLLWINLLTDGLPALALGADPKSEGIMQRPPRPKSEGVITKRMLTSIGGIGVLMAVTLLPLFYFNRGDLQQARTLVFTGLVIFEFVRIQAIRTRYDQSILTNKWLIAALLGSLALQLLVVYSPLNSYFGVVPIALSGWYQIAGSLVGFITLTYVFVKLEDHIFQEKH